MKFDILVIGGGHAGIEAANIAAKKQLSVLLITNHLDLIGQMSCNPAIGGIAKGTIVREVDALGGVMGKLIDRAGIHFRMLNKSKGAAVWGNRAQADKIHYRTLARKELEKNPRITLLQGMAKRILTSGDGVSGVEMDSGEKIEARAIVIAAGTFLDGVIHIGLSNYSGGRTGEPPSQFFAQSLADLGIKTGRLKTGTSPRIDSRTVNYDYWEQQLGDDDPWPFSFSTKGRLENKTSCWIGKTLPETHQIIRDNLDRSPLYSGKIKSIGPRYCPSIEDKVIRFGERGGHTLFLEPESLDNHELYLNGLSTSLPVDVQEKMVHSIAGLEQAAIIRPGYAIEYTYFTPVQLHATLESKIVKRLYFAGQVNGTSGYEEAACQGLLAGMNAAQQLFDSETIVLGRDSSYSGVLIDDLVTRGTEEPYRMFTSRAEHRLKLRQDNCDERLMPIAHRLGFIETDTYEHQQKKWETQRLAREALARTTVKFEKWEQSHPGTLKQSVKAADLLKRPEVTLEQIIESTGMEISEDRALRLAIESDIKYGGFVAKQDVEIHKMTKLETTKIPEQFNYDEVKGLLTESRLKLKVSAPATLGQASRVPGVTPADISLVALYLLKGSSR